jgi:hypothetical protein
MTTALWIGLILIGCLAAAGEHIRAMGRATLQELRVQDDERLLRELLSRKIER